ncbi:hypothetical protein GQ600_25677 [Phytophthora cactorum]|nr:hypothetical protein GQ600_25677 [Phytophthora cactorum]
MLRWLSTSSLCTLRCYTQSATTFMPNSVSCSTSGLAKFPLVPLLDKEGCDSNTHHDADAYIAVLMSARKPVKRHFEYVRFLVGDNYLHRYQDWDSVGGLRQPSPKSRHEIVLETYAGILRKINELMKLLCGLNQSANLPQSMPLEPVTRQATRWPSTFAMVERYFELKPFLDSTDKDLAAYVTSPLEGKRFG